MLLAFLISVSIAWASEDRVNKSISGLVWSTGKEGGLFGKSHSEEPVDLNDNDELDGGFSSLDGMLQWAIGIFLFVVSSNLYSHLLVNEKMDCEVTYY